MTNNKLPFTLVSVKLNVYGKDTPLPSIYPDESLFDSRSDFTINSRQSAIAVLLTFYNERALKDYDSPGIRRPVTVAVIDSTDACVLSSARININIPRGEENGIFRVDLPLQYSDINRDHSYKVRVRDENSGQILDDRVFHLFDESYRGKHISNCFNPISGGLAKLNRPAFYKSFHADCPGYYAIRFRMDISFGEMPWILPEMEVRIYYPDGSVDSRFGQPECQDYDMTEYQIEVPFFLQPEKRGIGYAELTCMDFPIAGFVFCTDADEVMQEWTGSELDCLEEYSLEAAVSRYRDLTASEDGAGENDVMFADDDFERALQDFISSQKDDDSAAEENTADDNVNGLSDKENDPVPEECDSTGQGSQADLSIPDISSSIQQENEMSIASSLSRLTGLKSVKEKLSVYEKIVTFNKMRLSNNLSANALPLHAMFLGSPGTGKTTVAKRMGIMLRRAGILSKGHVVVKERANLLGPYYSNEETNTINAIKEAQGGILFIDEAYQLYQPGDPRDPGKFVIEALMTALADDSNRDWMLILAGYPDEMKRMFEMNPGFKSRIPESNIYIFDDFSKDELMEIAEKYLVRNEYTLSPEARTLLEKRLATDYATRDKSFGNARHVINLIQTEILPAMAVRVASETVITPESLSLIQPSDIPAPKKLFQSSQRNIGYRA